MKTIWMAIIGFGAFATLVALPGEPHMGRVTKTESGAFGCKATMDDGWTCACDGAKVGQLRALVCEAP